MLRGEARLAAYKSLWDILERLCFVTGEAQAPLLQEFDAKVKAFYEACNCPAEGQAVETLIRVRSSYR